MRPPVTRMSTQDTLLRRFVWRTLRDARSHPLFTHTLGAPFHAMRRAGIRLPKQLYQHLSFRGDFEVALPTGASFRMRSYGDQLENEWYWAGVRGFEQECVLPWLSLARTAAVTLDIGANTGIYGLLACAANSGATVHAFEPLARVADRARENARLNSGFNLFVHQVAVSDQTGVGVLYDPGGENCYSASLESDFVPGTKSHQEVSVVTADDFVDRNQLRKVDLVKIDVEGHESEVLDGLWLTVKKFRPSVLLEYLPTTDTPAFRERIIRFRNDDYRFLHLSRTGPVEANATSPSTHSTNVLLVPTERIPATWNPLQP